MNALVHQVAANQNETTILVATAIALAVLLATFSAARAWPARRSATTPEQVEFLMGQLVTEKETTGQLRTELNATKAEVVSLRSEVGQLRTENASLRTQMEYVLSLMRGQAVAASSNAAATRPPQAGNSTRVATSHMTDGDVQFRDWLLRHFDADDLALLAANAGMERAPAGPITSMATALVQAARRMGSSETLEREALDMRPNVEAP